RETETLNKARQLVFSNDLAPNHLASPPPLPPQRLLSFHSHSHYPPPLPPAPASDFFLGHVLSEGNYTCIGAPVGQDGGGSTEGVRDVTLNATHQGLMSWGR
ncbi:zinc finger family protein, partial [Striga asiatica]